MKTPVPVRRLPAARTATALALHMLLVLLLVHSRADAQEFEFHAPAAANDASVAAVMRDLAERVLPVYQENNPRRYLTNLSALQLIAGNYPAAYATRQALGERRNAEGGGADGAAVLYDIYARARSVEAANKVSFAQAFTQSFRDTVARLSGPDAYAVTAWRGPQVGTLQDALQQSLDRRRARDTVSLAEAVDLLWTYFSFDSTRSFGPLADALDAEDERSRYLSFNNVLIKTPDGASISAVVVRPRNASGPLPTLLEFTIHASAQNYARECAAHGYVGVVAYVRGSRTSGAPVVPFEHDGEDARAVINWIATRPWSDGRVGMYGGSYSGFTQWAAAKHLPAALKAIATSAGTAPGIDFPMEGSIFLNSAYRWASDVTGGSGLNGKGAYDDAHWSRIDETWYRSGRPYQDLDRIYGRPSRFFHRWLNHPSYDLFWQKMLPYREEFSHIDIPVLATTGYYDSAEVGALYYFTQHYRYNAHADDTLLIGPYDDGVMQQAPLAELRGYQVDPAALIDLHALRYQWFDFVFKGAAKPALLRDRVNYEVMGANEWRHAPSLQAMANGSVRFYLDAASSADGHVLARHRSSNSTFVREQIDLADRGDAAGTPAPRVIGPGLQNRNGVAFVSEPLTRSIDFNGLFSGRLDFTTNKMDMDLTFSVYEQLPGGDYLQLFGPSYELRASYSHDRVHRRLLRAGERQQLTFMSERMMSRRLQAGSRVVVVLGINKRPDQEVNYGTPNNVSEDSIADSKTPLKIRWYSGSYIDFPVQR